MSSQDGPIIEGVGAELAGGEHRVADFPQIRPGANLVVGYPSELEVIDIPGEGWPVEQTVHASEPFPPRKSMDFDVLRVVMQGGDSVVVRRWGAKGWIRAMAQYAGKPYDGEMINRVWLQMVDSEANRG